MNYVELEGKLVDSIHRSLAHIDDDTRLELFQLTRKIDWPIVFQDTDRAVKGIYSEMSESMRSLISQITTGAILRIPELTANLGDLVDTIVDSVEWRSRTGMTRTGKMDVVTYNISDIYNYLTDSIDVVVLYMLSNLSLITTK